MEKISKVLCVWCKNREALPYPRYRGCCSTQCKDALEYDEEISELKQTIADKDKLIALLENDKKRLYTDVDNFMQRLNERDKLIERWVADGERLAPLVTKYGGTEIDAIGAWQQHNALMKEMEAKKWTGLLFSGLHS